MSTHFVDQQNAELTCMPTYGVIMM